jgi:glyoxylase I family protein
MALTCRDPLAVERFYTTYFGFKRARVVMPGAGQVVFLKKENVYLELFQAQSAAPLPPVGGAGPDYPGWRHLAFQVENVDAALAALGDQARITLGPLDFGEVIPGWRTAWIADPEGNIVEISQGFVDEENPPQP